MLEGAKRKLGAATEHRGTNPPQRADDLAAMVLADDSEREVRLGSLWEDRPVVLVFLRHYG